MANVLLHIKNVRKCYGEKEALKGVTLDIYEAKSWIADVQMAPPTTLSSIVATLHPPTQGDILYKGISIYNDIMRYRLQLGFCPPKAQFE